jgi:hypothetical protein
MLGEVLGYLEESVIRMDNPPYPKDVAGIELYGKMGVETRLSNMKERVRDLAKNVRGCKHEQENLSQMTDVINTTKLCASPLFPASARLRPAAQSRRLRLAA